MYYRNCIVGLQGSGKTQLSKKIAREFLSKKQKVLIIDLMKEYNLKGADIYRPVDNVNPVDEVSTIIQNYIINPFEENGSQPYRLVIFDESSRYFNNKLSLPKPMGYINDFARHLKINVITVARRFTQINTDLVELSHNLYIFNQSGLNDIKRLDELSIGLGDTVLNLKPYHYVYVNQTRQYEIKNPINIKVDR